MDGWAAHPMGWGGDGVVASPVEAPGVSLIARRCLSGATPRGQSWTSAGLLPHGRNGLNAQRMAVVSTFREPSLSPTNIFAPVSTPAESILGLSRFVMIVTGTITRSLPS